MTMNRRAFLKGATVGTAAVVATAGSAEARREPMGLPSKAVGILYDSTLCIGCKACVSACKVANGMPPETPEELKGWNQGTWDSPLGLSAKTLNVIRAYTNGDATVKDREVDGYAFIKNHCLHCVDPSCVSVCPVSAMQKDPDTGIVTHDPDACIGCRYCVYSCPFSVPKYEYDNPFGQIQKCQFCVHLQKEGKIPACADVCPTGATLFGTVEELDREADRRLAMKPGEEYEFPRGTLAAPHTHFAKAGTYQQHVYGRTENGGTQVRLLAAVPFEKLGMPALPEYSTASVVEGIQQTIYKGMVAPVAVLGLLSFLAHRNHEAFLKKLAERKKDKKEKDDG